MWLVLPLPHAKRTKKRQGSREMTGLEWGVPVDDPQMVAQLWVALDKFESESHQPRRTLEFLVDRFAGLRIEVFANEHPPPHFRVKCNGETTNYRISDCEQLNGGLQRYYRVIQDWHATNKRALIDAWNRLRPIDCPVGEYRGD
jgi:type I restriction enzyme, R subunit